MSCASFEQDLTRVMGEELDGPERAALIGRIRAHGLACDTCRGTLDLLDVLERTPESRDRDDDPGEAYWADFDQRLQQRVADEGTGAARPRRRHGVWWSAAAASLAIVGLIGWMALRGTVPPAAPDVGSVEPAAGLPPSLVSTVEAASSEELEAELATLSGWGEGVDLDTDSGAAAGWERGLLPEVHGLDAQARRELLDWLKEQNARSGGA